MAASLRHQGRASHSDRRGHLRQRRDRNSVSSTAEVAEEAAPVPSRRAAQLAALHPQRATLELAWPGIVENVIAFSGQAAIFAFVGHLGAVATSAVGAAFQFSFLLFPIWRSLAIGTMAHVSRRMGEGRPHLAADVTRQSLVVGAIAGLVVGSMFIIFAAPLLRLLGASEDVVATGVPILALIGAGSAFQTVWFIGVSAVRAAGDSRTPMWIAVLSAALTVPLAYVFIEVVRVGPIGAAYAVVLDGAVICVLVIAVLWRGSADLRLGDGSWRLDRAT